MNVIINGEEQRLDGPDTIDGLLAHLELDGRKVAIERNLEIVPKSAYATTWLADGDRLEIVHFIGGGGDRLLPTQENGQK
jgi:thiamine biosynthesis protein ThiS